MATAPDRYWHGWYFDGRTAGRTPVTVRVLREGLGVIGAEGGSRWWSYEEIRRPQETHAGDPVRFEHGGEPPEVLIVPDPSILQAIAAAAPHRQRFRAPARRSVGVLTTIATAVALVLLGWVLYVWGIPALANAVAVRLPVAWEEQLGEVVVEELAPAARRCRGQSQQDALEQILARLAASAAPAGYRYTLLVMDATTPNAFAAPGGYLVFTQGLLRLADRPEEVAGVMAHEIQHVVQRHATKLLVRELSLRALVSLAGGDLRGLGSALDAARTIGGLRYQRADETSADMGAVRLLAAARVDPGAMVTLLEKLRPGPGTGFEPPAYLSTHPALDDRIAALRRMAASEAPVTSLPLLPRYPWGDIPQICAPS
jgi:Zn-dependent protease with chaperone function